MVEKLHCKHPRITSDFVSIRTRVMNNMVVIQKDADKKTNNPHPSLRLFIVSVLWLNYGLTPHTKRFPVSSL